MGSSDPRIMDYGYQIILELFTKPINLVLLGVCGILVYKIFKARSQPLPIDLDPPLPKLKRRDFLLDDLRPYDGKTGEKRILIAVNGNVFDVTAGKNFYGPDGPYSVFAGRDASRGLGTFSVGTDALRDEYDDLSDLKSEQRESIKEWELQFREKYHRVGRLLKPGEKPTDYSDAEETPPTDAREKKTH